MNVFDLFAKLSIDSSGFERGLTDAKGDAKDAGKNIDKTLGDSAKSSEKKVGSLGDAAKDSGKKISGLGEHAKGAGDAIESTSKISETAKNKIAVLSAQYDAARKSVEDLTKEFNESVEKTGAASRESEALAAQLNKAENEANDLRKQLDKTSSEVGETGEKFGGLGDQIDGVAQKLGIHVPDAAKEALNGMDGFSAGTVAAMGAAAGAISAIYAAIKKVFDITLESAAYADELLTKSAKTGLSTDLLQGIDYASKLLDFEGLEQSLTRLTNSMASARDGAKEQSAAFAALGISVTDLDGNLLDNWETFKNVIDSLGQVENATERDALANDIFGRSFAELKPLISAGSQELQGYIDELKTSGRMMNEDQVKALGAVDDSYQELTTTISSFKNMVAAEAAPAVKTALDTFSNAFQKGGKALLDSGIVANLALILESTISIIDAGAQLIDAFPEWLNPIKNLSNEFKGLAIVLATIADAVNVISGIFSLDFNKVKTALGFNGKNGQYSNLQKLNNSGSKAQYQNYYDYDPETYWTDTPQSFHNASGTKYWKGGVTWVGENGPERVDLPQGSRIWNTDESRRMASTTVTNYITVNGIKELDELLSWFESRRVEERMA